MPSLVLLKIIYVCISHLLGIIDGTKYIINGNQAAPKQFPSQAFLEIKKFICSGTVLSSSVVLTAAHCLVKRGSENHPEDSTNVFVYAGIVNLAERRDSYGPSKILIHENFNMSSSIKAFDIALIHLMIPFVLSDTIQPAKLPIYAAMVTQYVTIAGCGVTENGFDSQELQYVGMTLINDEDCQEKSRKMEPGSVLCAIGINRGTCHGDSGSGILLQQGNDVIVVGVLSFSIVQLETKKCVTQYPSVGTNVFHFLDWIEQGCRF